MGAILGAVLGVLMGALFHHYVLMAPDLSGLELFVPAVVTAENIKAEIFDKGINTPEEVCTGEYAEGCKALGITQ